VQESEVSSGALTEERTHSQYSASLTTMLVGGFVLSAAPQRFPANTKAYNVCKDWGNLCPPLGLSLRLQPPCPP